MHDVLVLGAGLSGLSAARRLSLLLPRGASIALLDSSPRPGGWVDSHAHRLEFKDTKGVKRQGEVVCESGPRTVRPQGGPGAMRMLRLVRDLGLTDSLLATAKTDPAAKNRFILDPTTSQLNRVSTNPFDSPLARQLITSILLEPFRRRPAHHNSIDESVASFLSRRLGPGLAPLVSAFIHGVYAADANSLSAEAAFAGLIKCEREYGSILLGVLRGGLRGKEDEGWAELGELGKEREKWSTWSLRGGLGRLTEGLLEDVRGRGVEVDLGTRAERIEPTSDGIEVHTSSTSIQAKHVISALPPNVLKHLAPSLNATPSLSDPRATVGVVNLVFPLAPSSIHPPGFGYLVPRAQASNPPANPEGVLGVVFDSTAVPGSDGELEGHVTRLTVMLGGPHWSSYPSSPSNSSPLLIPPESHLTELALSHLRRVFPHLKGVTPLLAVPQINRSCIPTYAPGHADRMRQLHARIGEWSGGRVSVVGSGYGGVSVNDCVRSGEEVAEALASGNSVTGLERFLRP